MKSSKLIYSGLLFSLLPTALQLNAANNKFKEREQENKKPNILFIVSEDNGMELSCYGSPIKTPNLDNIASQGTRFANSYVPQAGSSPSRACFFTSLYPHQNGQVGLATWDYSMYQKETPNFVNDLKKGGYKTGCIGKIHVNPEDAFDFDWHEIDGGNFQRKKLDNYTKSAFNFMNESDSPFYLQVNYPDAHEPFLPQVDGRPKIVLTKDDVEVLPYFGVSSDRIKQQVADYYNCMARLDELVGELIVKLKETGKYENTLIVYIGDHGADMLRGKRTVYEGGLRIPLIMSFPPFKITGNVYNELVSTLDLYPTFMEIAGLPVPKHLQGKALLNVIKGDKKPVREYLFAEFNVHSNHNPYPQRSVRDAKYKLIYNPAHGHTNPGYDYTIGKKIEAQDFYDALKNSPANVQEAYKRMKNPPKYELYDLTKDPFEWDNLAEKPEFKTVLNKYTKILHDWQRETNDPFINEDVAVRFLQEIIDSKEQKIFINYHEYMDPHYKFVK